MSLKFGPIRPRPVELAALERLEKFPSTYNGRNVVSTLLILAGKEDNHKSLDEFEFGWIPALTAELAAL